MAPFSRRAFSPSALLLLLATSAAACAQPSDPPGELLNAAVAAGDSVEVKRLLASGISVEEPGGGDWASPPLVEASKRGHADLVRLLLRKGAAVNAESSGRVTALHRVKTAEIAGILLAHGADLEARQLLGRTPLWLAVEGGRTEVVRYLLTRGADPHVANVIGDTPLHTGAVVETAAILADAGADVNARAENGDTPLDRAVGLSHDEYAAFLRSRGGVEMRARRED